MDSVWIPPVTKHAALLGLRGWSHPQASMWTAWPALGVLVDVGEGVAGSLGDAVGTLPILAITHGHGDHVLGLPGLIIARMGHTTRRGGPLQIYYPADIREVAILRAASEDLFRYSAADDWARITWHPIAPGARIPLAGRRSLVAFATQHYTFANSPATLGYAVVTPVQRRRAAWWELPDAEVHAAIQAHGRDAIFEAADDVLMAMSGDTMPVDVPALRDARVRVLDATFLTAAERGAPTHAAVEEWVTLLRGTPGHVVFHHLSLRYEDTAAMRAIVGLVGDAFPGGVSVMHQGTCTVLVPPLSPVGATE